MNSKKLYAGLTGLALMLLPLGYQIISHSPKTEKAAILDVSPTLSVDSSSSTNAASELEASQAIKTTQNEAFFESKPAGAHQVSPAPIISADDSLRKIQLPAFLDARTTTVLRTWPMPKDDQGPARTASLYSTDFHYPIIRAETLAVPDDGTDQPAPIQTMIGDHLIVVPSANASKAELRTVLLSEGFIIRETPATSQFLIAAFDPLSTADSLKDAQARLNAMGNPVAYAEPDYLQQGHVLPNDPAYTNGNLWGLNHYSDYDLDAPQAWDRRTSASDVVVAVLDTGIRTTHLDLLDNLWVNSGEIPGDGIDNDQNGWIDDHHGANFINSTGNPNDDNGHGTHVAGTIGAVGNNGLGGTGVAWDVQLMGLKFLSARGTGATSDAVSGVDYATAMGADIINASFGGGGYSRALRDAINRAYAADIIFVAAAGNSSTNNDFSPHYPSSYELNNIVSVASHRRDGELSYFSNHGQASVDISAPGDSIWSTFTRDDNSYEYLSGTSMAAPHVSGALALLKAEFPQESAALLLDRLYASVKVSDGLRARVRSGGAISLQRAFAHTAALMQGDAYEAPISLAWPYAAWTGSNASATDDGFEAHSAERSGNRSLWFTWRAQENGWGKVTFTSDSPAGWLAIFDDSSPSSSALALSDSGQSTVYFKAIAGTRYRLRVDSDQVALNNFNFSIAQRAPNDHMRDAIVVSESSFSLDGHNFATTHEPAEPRHARVGLHSSVWYQWTAPSEGLFYLNTRGSQFDTVLAAYTSNAGVLSEIASNDDGGYGLTSALSFNAVAGQTYLFAIDAYRQSPSGLFQLNGNYASDILIHRQPESRHAKIGDTVTLAVGAQSGLRMDYQWYKDGLPIPGGRQSILRIYSTRNDDFGNYYAEVHNEHTSVQSETVEISEFKSAPAIAWQSGNLSAAIGTYAELSVRAYGSQPLTYQWKKDGLALPNENLPLLSFDSIQASHAGLYEVVISNDVGTAQSLPIVVGVVSNPLEKWNWRNPWPQGSNIVSLMANEGTFYALATGSESVLLRSAEGRLWETIELPGGIRLAGLAHGQGKFVAVGRTNESFSMTHPVLISVDGVNWTKHLIDFNRESPGNVEFTNGRFVLRTGSNTVWYSSDGLNWSKAPLTGIGKLLSGNGRFLAIQTGNKKVYSSVDAITWTEVEIPSEIWPRPSVMNFVNGYFHISYSSDVFRSTDGVTWEYLGRGGLKTHMAYRDGLYYGIEGSTLYSSSALPTWTSLGGIPGSSNARDINHLVTSDSHIVIAGESGLVAGASSFDTLSLEDFSPIDDDFERVFATDHGFYAIAKFATRASVFYSADGSDWSAISTPYDIDYDLEDLQYAGGQFWAPSDNVHSSGDQFIYSGSSPATLQAQVNAPQGLVVDMIYGLGRYYLLQKVQGSSSNARLYESTDGSNWTLNEAIPVSTSSRLYAMDGRVIVSSWQRVNVTTDGSTWNTLTLAGGYGWENSIYAESGTLYVYDSYDYFHVSQNNGQSWTKNRSNLNLSGRLQLFKRNGQFVLAGGSKLYVSDDGITWTTIELNNAFNSVAIGLGTIVGVGDNGIILQSGNAPSAAPVCEIVAPINGGTVTQYSTVQVRVNAFDPEGDLDSVLCYWDDQLVYSGNREGEHAFTVLAPDHGTKNLRMLATDTSGLTTSKLARIVVAESQAPTFTEAISNRDFGRTTVIDGDIYLFTDSGTMLKGRDFSTWESLALPKGIPNPEGITQGGERLVLTGGFGVFYTSLDGQNWTASEVEFSNNHTIIQTASYRDGYFVAPYRYSSSGDGIVYSADGFEWHYTGTTFAYRFDKIVLGDSGTGLAINSGHAQSTDLLRFQIDEDAEKARYFGTGQGRALDAEFGNGHYVAAIADGTVRVSSDTMNWQTSDWTGTPPTDIDFVAGRFFLRKNATILAVSEDGLVWQSTTGNAIAYAIYFYDERFVGATQGSVVVSLDGVDWQKISDNPARSLQIWQLSDGTYASQGYNYGIAYSHDLIHWDLEELSDDNDTIHHIVANDSIWLAKHTGFNMGIAWSTDSGKSWHAPESGFSTWRNYTSVEPVAFGADTFLVNVEGDLYRSTDGKHWEITLEDGPTGVQYDSLRQAFVGTHSGGRYAHSVDGITWNFETIDVSKNTAAIIPGGKVLVALQGSGLHALEGLSISNDDGITWSAGALPIGKVKDFAVLNGDIVLLIQRYNYTYDAYISSDGVNWTQSNETLPAEINYSGALSAGLEGLVSVNQSGEIHTSSNGLDWEAVAQIDSVNGVSIVGESILLTGKRLVVYTAHDWVNRSVSVEGGIYGIGDPIQINFEVLNASGLDTEPRAFDIEFRLSADSFWSPDDAPLGIATVSENLPLPNQNASGTVQGALPESILGGEYFVLARIDPQDTIAERSEGNNYTGTTLPTVVVPEWVLDVDVDGSGETDQDTNAIRYAHNSEVNLIARENKRTEFAGWQGDNEGGLGQLTLRMDADKSLTALFKTYHLITTNAIGGGRIEVSTNKDRYESGETLQISAVAEPGWTFAGWDGDLSGSNPTHSFEINSDKDLTAYFSQSYAQWQSIALSSVASEDRVPMADPDKDKVLNIQEYLSGGNPTEADDTNSQVQTLFSSESIILRYWIKRGMLDGSVTLLSTSNLSATWQPLQGFSRILQERADLQHIEVELPFESGSQYFLKLEYNFNE